MRLIGFVAVLLFLAPMQAGAQATEPEFWLPWAEDPQETPSLTLSGDFRLLEAGLTADALHLRLKTHEADHPRVAPSSEATFVAKQDDRVSVRFVWGLEPTLSIDGEVVDEGWELRDGSEPLSWHIVVPWATVDVSRGATFWLEDLEVLTRDAVVDLATGPDLEFAFGSTGAPVGTVRPLHPGGTIEGPDFAGGASVTVDVLGRPLVAFYVYDADRGQERGIYLARVNADGDGLLLERLADSGQSRDLGRDAQMRTQVAHDGEQTFVLYTADPAVDNDEDGPGHPGTPDTVRVLAKTADGWQAEDPTPGGDSDVGPEDVADLVARDGRVFAAVPVGDDNWIVERTGPGAWSEVTRLAGAHNAKLAIDSDGGVHAAFVAYGDPDTMREGELFYARAPDYEPMPVGQNIDAGWEEPETDGSFAIATGPDDRVAILWNDGRARERDEEQRVLILHDGTERREFVPLVPGHGNPQYTMRLGFADDGSLHAASGYGGTDTLASRGPDGGWLPTELPRYDVWDMAVAPVGTVFFAYTEPHGGTTLALSAYAAEPGEAPADAPRATNTTDAGDDPPRSATNLFDATAPEQESPGPALVFVLLGVLAAARSRRSKAA